MKIFIIDDDREFSNVVEEMILRGVGSVEIKIQHFTNAIAAINATAEDVPDLIFLDVLLDGPDGFTFLNEMQSYEDLAQVPVVLLTSLDFTGRDLKRYGVVSILNKSEMTPEQINKLVEQYGRIEAGKGEEDDK